LTKKGNIIYLYSEVMPYTIGVMRELVRSFGYQVDCIYWDERKRTPFLPVDEAGITFHKRSDFDAVTLSHFIESRMPSVIYVVGRMDPLYLAAARRFRKQYRIVTGSDNQWNGSRKQWLSVLLSRWIYHRYFDYFWVPGNRQHKFARMMGYPEDRIIPNLLSGDAAVFNGVFAANRQAKAIALPHTIVFTGRFAAEKGLDLLVKAFNEVRAELSSDWKLLLAGSGHMDLRSDAHTTVMGFMSMHELAAASKGWGVFCLPSLYEPWGVVIHEFTMAGLPIICSDRVGAADNLVIDNETGYIFRSGDLHDLKRVIRQVMLRDDSELLAMGDRGHELAARYSPFIAAQSLVGIIK